MGRVENRRLRVLLDARIPPPVVVVLLAAVMWLLARGLSGLAIAPPLHDVAAIAIAAAGVLMNAWPKRAFKRVGTTVNPLRPAASSELVTDGVYRHTRNPMYLGHALIVLAWAVHLGNVVCVLAVPAYMLYITRFQILAEERALALRFGQAYAAYRERVPRWW